MYISYAKYVNIDTQSNYQKRTSKQREFFKTKT